MMEMVTKDLALKFWHKFFPPLYDKIILSLEIILFRYAQRIPIYQMEDYHRLLPDYYSERNISHTHLQTNHTFHYQ